MVDTDDSKLKLTFKDSKPNDSMVTGFVIEERIS
jgi:hypothetical protein